jgi:uncharacterized protein YjbI with pentapeptide repeats
MACCNLENCILSGADFEDPTGKISNLEGANLKNANARMVNSFIFPFFSRQLFTE